MKTIDGDAEIKVPKGPHRGKKQVRTQKWTLTDSGCAGTQPETRLRIRGRGVPKLGKPQDRFGPLLGVVFQKRCVVIA